MAWVVELTGVDTYDGALKTKVFAMGAGIAFTDAPHAPSALVSWKSPSQKIEVSQEGVVQTSSDQGQIVLANLPPDSLSPGPLDYLATWAWNGRTARLYKVDNTWAGRVLVAFGVLENPVASMTSGDSSNATITFILRDPRASLNAPLQTSKYGGTNVGGNGVDGEDDIKGQPRPILYGIASNFEGVKVNASKLIWELCDKAATVLCVRVGGGAITAGVNRANVASLEANVPDPGKYDWTSTATGTYVRLGTIPNFVVTFDAEEGALPADRTHAQVWKRLRVDRCGNVAGDIYAASVAALDGIDPNEVGFWWGEEKTRLEAVNEVLGSLSGYEVLGFDGDWRVAKLLAPSGDTVIDLIQLGIASEVTTKMRPVTSPIRVRPNFAPDGSPPYRVVVGWGRNYRIMAESEFVGYVKVDAPRLIEKFSKDYRTAPEENAAIWDPVAGTGLYPNAPELRVNTGYQPGVDGLTCPHGEAEAARLLALYSALPAQYQMEYVPEPTDNILPGDVVSFQHPQFNLQAGPHFRVLQAGLTVDAKGAMMELVVGLPDMTPQLDFTDEDNSGYIVPFIAGGY